MIFGLLAVLFLIKENILTWPCGIIYVLVSFVVFAKARLYGDFILHIFFFVLNIYGWIYWTRKRPSTADSVSITTLTLRDGIGSLVLSFFGIFLFAQFLISLPNWIQDVPPAALPYWDSTTSILSVTGMWLTARKKIENWYYWLAVDILATGIYYYKELYFYSLLYCVYIGMAIAGYLAWRKSMRMQLAK